jgi:flotillin
VFQGIEIWQMSLALVGTIVLFILLFFSAMARFLKRPSPSEAIIRIGRVATDVFIARACWIVPVLHRATTMSLSTIGLTISRTAHDALVSKDFISTNLSAEFYIRVEPNEDDVKKAARTIGIDEGHASSDAIRHKAQQLLEPKLVGALRAVAAQNEFLALHLNREHFAEEVSNALREDLGRNGFTLESVTITELTQTPLSEMRVDDIFGASGRETVTNTVVDKNIAVRRKIQEEAERTAEIDRQQVITVATQNRIMREGQAREEEAAVKAELAKNEALEARDLQRQATVAIERARTAQDSAEAEARKAAALAVREKADQEVITVQQVAQAERQKQVAIVAAEKVAAEERIAADVSAYRRRMDADGVAQAQRAAADGQAEAVKIKARADAEAAELQALSITKLAEANREAGLKEAEVLREKIAVANAKKRDLLLQETAQSLIANASAIVRELVKPAERIGEIKVLQVAGLGGGNGQAGAGLQAPLLGNALGPVAKTILEASALAPVLKEVMRFADIDVLKSAMNQVSAVPTNGVSAEKSGHVPG